MPEIPLLWNFLFTNNPCPLVERCSHRKFPLENLSYVKLPQGEFFSLKIPPSTESRYLQPGKCWPGQFLLIYPHVILNGQTESKTNENNFILEAWKIPPM